MLGMLKLHSTASVATVLRADLLVEETGMPGDTTTGYVLGRLPDNHAQQYVTWRVMIDEEGVGFHASSGNYHSTYEDAHADYNRRRGVAKTRPTELEKRVGETLAAYQADELSSTRALSDIAAALADEESGTDV